MLLLPTRAIQPNVNNSRLVLSPPRLPSSAPPFSASFSFFFFSFSSVQHCRPTFSILLPYFPLSTLFPFPLLFTPSPPLPSPPSFLFPWFAAPPLIHTLHHTLPLPIDFFSFGGPLSSPQSFPPLPDTHHLTLLHLCLFSILFWSLPVVAVVVESGKSTDKGQLTKDQQLRLWLSSGPSITHSIRQAPVVTLHVLRLILPSVRSSVIVWSLPLCWLLLKLTACPKPSFVSFVSPPYNHISLPVGPPSQTAPFFFVLLLLGAPLGCVCSRLGQLHTRRPSPSSSDTFRRYAASPSFHQLASRRRISSSQICASPCLYVPSPFPLTAA